MENFRSHRGRTWLTPSLNILSNTHDVKYKLATLGQGASHRALCLEPQHSAHFTLFRTSCCTVGVINISFEARVNLWYLCSSAYRSIDLNEALPYRNHPATDCGEAPEQYDKMLRNAATRSLLKSFPKPTTSRASFTAASAQFRNVTPRQLTPLSRPQILLLARPNTTTLYSTNFDKIDPKAEKKVADKVLEPHPEEISGASSVRPVFEGRSNHEDGEDMMAGIKADLKTIKETFTLSDVPRDTLLLGAAGVIPYAATSLSTVYLAWDINQSHATHGRGVLFSPEQATQYLEMITPLQIGWGAIVGSMNFQTEIRLIKLTRLFPSWVPSIGDSNMRDMVVITATAATYMVLPPQPLHGQLFSCQLNTR
jgi:hypothetical protein